MSKQGWTGLALLVGLVVALLVVAAGRKPQIAHDTPVPLVMTGLGQPEETDLVRLASPGADAPHVPAPQSRNIKTLPPAQWQPLPAEHVPVRSIYAMLKARADSGDAPAACRLAAELGRCLALASTLESIQQGDPKVKAALAGPNAEVSREHHQSAMNCGGLSRTELSGRIGFLRQAAMAGNIAAIEEYVGANWVHQDLYAASFHLDDYRNDAPRLAEVALQSGSVPILFDLHGVYGGHIGQSLIALSMDRPNHPRRAEMLDMLMNLAVQSPSRSMLSTEQRLLRIRARYQAVLAETEYQKLEAITLKRYEAWFQGRPKVFQLAGLTSPMSGNRRRDFNGLCSTGYATAEALETPIDWQD